MHPWIVGIGTGTVVLFLTILVDLITAVKLFSTIKRVITTIWKAILAFLNYKLKVWWVLIGLAVVVFGLYLFVKYIEYEQKQKENNKPPFLEYTQGHILGYSWKWAWRQNVYGKYEVDDLHPVCSRCGTPIVNNMRGCGGSYMCLRCNEVYTLSMPDLSHVKMMIHDNVRRKYFPDE